MEIINSWQGFEKHLYDILENDTNIDISTFGVSAKVLKGYSKKVRRLLVGTSYSLCHSSCTVCEEKASTRHEFLTSYLSNFSSARLVENVHMKMVISDQRAIVGGINLTGSEWEDAAFVVTTELSELRERFDEVYTKAKDITPPKATEPSFTFGKYKGEQLSKVLERDPKYFKWCVYNVDGFDIFSEKLLTRAH